MFHLLTSQLIAQMRDTHRKPFGPMSHFASFGYFQQLIKYSSKEYFYLCQQVTHYTKISFFKQLTKICVSVTTEIFGNFLKLDTYSEKENQCKVLLWVQASGAISGIEQDENLRKTFLTGLFTALVGLASSSSFFYIIKYHVFDARRAHREGERERKRVRERRHPLLHP